MSLNYYLFVKYQYNKMDSIDITDSAFSLGMPDLDQVISSGGSSSFGDYNTFIYVGGAILIIFICMLVYRYYQNKKASQMNSDTEDCPGGFCTMNQKHL